VAEDGTFDTESPTGGATAPGSAAEPSGRDTGAVITRVLLVLGLVLMLYVVIVVGRALS
jgi:hypothetical protein